MVEWRKSIAMAKSPEMEKFLNQFAKSIFGRGRDEGVCVTCGSGKVGHEDFRDAISRREWEISKMCQKCQDGVFGGGELTAKDYCPNCGSIAWDKDRAYCWACKFDPTNPLDAVEEFQNN